MEKAYLLAVYNFSGGVRLYGPFDGVERVEEYRDKNRSIEGIRGDPLFGFEVVTVRGEIHKVGDQQNQTLYTRLVGDASNGWSANGLYASSCEARGKSNDEGVVFPVQRVRSRDSYLLRLDACEASFFYGPFSEDVAQERRFDLEQCRFGSLMEPSVRRIEYAGGWSDADGSYVLATGRPDEGWVYSGPFQKKIAESIDQKQSLSVDRERFVDEPSVFIIRLRDYQEEPPLELEEIQEWIT